MKALLINLPIPELYAEQYRIGRNFPLAAGYLKSAARNDPRTGHWNNELLGRLQNDRAGDARLVDHICREGSDVLAMSLYCWNKNRSLYIAGEIKKKCPSMTIVAGGPEVNLQAPDIAAHPAIDVAVAGAGELSWPEILHRVEKGIEPAGAPGTLYCRNGSWCLAPSAPLDPSMIPSPFLDHSLDCRDYRYVLLETTRGCPRRCAYCSEKNRSLEGNGSFPAERAAREIAHLREQGVKGIYVIDSAFNLHGGFDDLCRAMRQARGESDMVFHVSFLAGAGSSHHVACLDPSFIVDVGLQSMSAEAQSAVARGFNLDEFLETMRRLASRGIDRKAHVILGLPGDTGVSLRAMASFLEEEHEVIPRLVVFILQLLRDTELYRDREKLGLLCQHEPPYYTLGSPALSFDGLREAIALFDEKFGDPRWHRTPPRWTRTSGENCGGASAGERETCPPERSGELPVTTIIVDLDDPGNGAENIRLGPDIARRLANSVTLWLEKTKRGHLGMIKSLLAPLSAPNPYCIWNIIVEPAEVWDASMMEEIKEAVTYIPNYLDYASVFLQHDPRRTFVRKSTRLFILIDCFKPFSGEWVHEMARSCPVYWKLSIDEGTPIPDAADFARYRLAGEGIVVAFAPPCPASKILESLSVLRSLTAGMNVGFTDWVLQKEWESGGSYADMSHVAAMEEHIVTLSSRGIRYHALTRRRVAGDYLAWMKRKGARVW
jgi:hypothetical protein